MGRPTRCGPFPPTHEGGGIRALGTELDKAIHNKGKVCAMPCKGREGKGLGVDVADVVNGVDVDERRLPMHNIFAYLRNFDGNVAQLRVRALVLTNKDGGGVVNVNGCGKIGHDVHLHEQGVGGGGMS